MAAFWYLSDTDQGCTFRQDIWKTTKCPSVFLWYFTPRIHKGPQDEKTRRFASYSGYYFTYVTIHMFLILKRSMTVSDYTYSSECHCIKDNVKNGLKLRDKFGRISLASILFIRCNQSAQNDGDNAINWSKKLNSRDRQEVIDKRVRYNQHRHKHGKIWQMRKLINSSLKYNDSWPSKLNWSVGHMLSHRWQDDTRDNWYILDTLSAEYDKHLITPGVGALHI